MEQLAVDIMRTIYKFVEDDYIPIFRQVSKKFKEITELEVELDEGILYSYGKVKKYRSRPPFNVKLSKYVASKDLFFHALKNGYKFRSGMHDIFTHRLSSWVITMLKHGCRELVFDFCLKFLFDRNKSQSFNRLSVVGFLIKRWHSLVDMKEYERLGLISGYSKQDVLNTSLCCGVDVDVISWFMVEKGCEWQYHYTCDLFRSKNLNLIRSIMEGKIEGLCERIASSVTYNRYKNIPNDWRFEAFVGSLIHCDFEIFNYIYQSHREYYTSRIGSDKVVERIIKLVNFNDKPIERIFDFLIQDKMITLDDFNVELLSSQYQWRILCWFINKGGIVREFSFEDEYFYISDEFSSSMMMEQLFLRLINMFHHTISHHACVKLFRFSIENGHLQLFDLIFPQIREHLTQEHIAEIFDWSKFKSIDRFVKIMISVYANHSLDFKLILSLVKSGSFEYLQWLYDNNFEIHKKRLRISPDIHWRYLRRMHEWLSSLD